MVLPTLNCLFECAVRIVDNNDLLNQRSNTLFEREMSWIVMDVVIPVLETVELDDEGVLNAILPPMR